MNTLAPPAPAGNRSVDLARHGFAIFPLTSNKLPFANESVATVLGMPTPPKGQGGVWLATRDETAIARLWTAFPGALIGIATGAASGGIIALDVDRKNGRDGLHTLAALGRQLPTTAWQQTPSGGYHYLYRGPAGQGLPTDASGLGEALDRRGDGGYIVDYGFDLAAPLAIAPEWLLAGARALGNADRKPFGTDCAPTFADAVAALSNIDNP
nr:bifunctional DNA primase/polymerase [Mesorhizobium sp. WSM4875]